MVEVYEPFDDENIYINIYNNIYCTKCVIGKKQFM